MKNDNNITIRIQNLSKTYKKRMPDGTLKDFNAVNNLNLEVKKGEMLGIIGKNGSGKSTLLKMLSGITKPTKGRIEMNGIVTSILDIGTGFHPDLSGKENIYLKGEFLGMSKSEIELVYNKIVEFSEIGDFIYTAVKHYSSGMFLRLAFSIIIHLNSDILLLDEVISVGDYKFTRKCMDFIESRKTQTIILVSHDLQKVINLCDRVILLDKGSQIDFNNREDLLHFHTKMEVEKKPPKNLIDIQQVAVIELNSKMNQSLLTLTIDFIKRDNNANIGFSISDGVGNRIIGDSMELTNYRVNELHQFQCDLSSMHFNKGIYYVDVILSKNNSKVFIYRSAAKFKIKENSSYLLSKDNHYIPLGMKKSKLTVIKSRNNDIK